MELQLKVEVPNITGTFATSSNVNKCSGAFVLGEKYSGNGSQPQDNFVIDYKAYHSSEIYQGQTLQPSAISMLPCIRF